MLKCLQILKKKKRDRKKKELAALGIFLSIFPQILLMLAAQTSKLSVKVRSYGLLLFFFSFSGTLCINHSNDKVQKILEGKIYQSSLREEAGATHLSDRKFIGLIFLWEM